MAITYKINLAAEVATLDLSVLRTLCMHSGVFVTNKMCRPQIEVDFLNNSKGRKYLFELANDRRAKNFVEDALIKKVMVLPLPTLDERDLEQDSPEEKKQSEANHSELYAYKQLIIAIKNYIRNNQITNLRWENGDNLDSFRVAVVHHKKAA